MPLCVSSEGLEPGHRALDEGQRSHNHEEWKTGDTGYLSNLWYEDVPNRQELGLCWHIHQNRKSWSFLVLGCPAFSITIRG